MKKKITIVCVFSLTLLAWVALGQATEQNAASGAAERLRIFNERLKAFNAGDGAGLAKFVKEHIPEKTRQGRTPEAMAQSELGLRDRVGGGFDLYKIEKNADNELTAVLKSHGEFPMFARTSWKFDAEQPDLILRQELGPIETPVEALPPKQSAETLAKELDAKLTKRTAEDKFSGAVLIAKDGKPVWQKAYGYADRESKTPNNLETRFRLGSMNKMLTSVAIAQLVQAGKLKYTDTLAVVLPDYPDKDVAKKVTIHHLLTHTSGLGDIFGPEFNQKKIWTTDTPSLSWRTSTRRRSRWWPVISVSG